MPASRLERGGRIMNYDLVKRLAKQIGRSTRDLIVLSPTNDPFYAGCPFRSRDAFSHYTAST